jgi:chromate transporter
VTPGWLSEDDFIAGYGAAQAVPGPLFAFAAYLGAEAEPSPHGWTGAAIALGAIYVPSFLLLAATLPLWQRLRSREWVQAALRGVGAAVVGLLVAALYEPVWTSAILAPEDFAVALVALGLLAGWRAPAWAVVLVAAAGGELIALR